MNKRANEIQLKCEQFEQLKDIILIQLLIVCQPKI